MEIFINSFAIIFLGEIGDKTQLLTLVLVMRYKKIWPIFWGIFFATISNHFLASIMGSYIGNQAENFISGRTLEYAMASIFICFGLWVLVPDKAPSAENDIKAPSGWGAFLTTTVAFFIAEMGDKTQLATIALSAKYSNVAIVTLATTLGMMLANALPLFFGEKLLKKIPMNIVRILACTLFVIFGIIILINIWNS